jgi:hypothetical protein
MILIAHRGNTSGKNKKRENTISYIEEALKKGYHCEIDLCKFDGEKFYLGHDEPGEAVSMDWLGSRNVWCHAKEYKTLEALVTLGVHCFWHESDKYTITSQGWIWAYPGQPGGQYTIAVHPEKLTSEEVEKFAGVCSDNIDKYKEIE